MSVYLLVSLAFLVGGVVGAVAMYLYELDQKSKSGKQKTKRKVAAQAGVERRKKKALDTALSNVQPAVQPAGSTSASIPGVTGAYSAENMARGTPNGAAREGL